MKGSDKSRQCLLDVAMEGITVNDLVTASRGTLLWGDGNAAVTGIAIDSRKVKPGDLFVPLIGEHTDAHNYIEEVFVKRGAQAVLSSRPLKASWTIAAADDKAIIQVDDTKDALQAIGSYYRNRLTLPLVGVTGSVGKTTTREMIAAALSAGYRVYKTPGNHNSQVGVPMTLTEIGGQDQAGVIELGMSEPGELTVIARIARIDMAVITNIGVAHIEQLGSKEKILQEKLTIQDGLKTGGILFLNGDDPLLKRVAAKEGCGTVYYGTGENSWYRAEEIRLENGYPRFTAVCGNSRISVGLHILGAHQVLNAMAALAVADHMHVPLEAAARQLELFEGVKNRQQIYYLRNQMVMIDDTYNASPVSVNGAVDILASRQDAGRRIAVLADMKELGAEAERYHRQVGEYLGKKPVDLLIVYGELAKEIKTGALQSNSDLETFSFSEGQKEELKQWLLDNLQPKDCILLKGSNSMKLGEVAEYVRQRYH